MSRKRQNVNTVRRKTRVPPAELPIEYIAKDQDVLGDGFCGFRVIAFHILGNDEEHMTIKKSMLGYVIANRDYCHEHICGKNDEVLDKLIERLEYGISPESVEIAKTSVVPKKYWFNGMTDIQVAANTFETPIASYSSHCVESHPSYLYLPHCKITDQKHPFIMHYIHDYHWRTFILKGASDLLWPSVYNIKKQMHIWTDVLHLVETDQEYRSHWGYLRIKESPTIPIQYDLVETDDGQNTKPNSNDGITQSAEAMERNDEEILREGIENGYPESPDIGSIARRVKEMKGDIDMFIHGKKRSLFASKKDKPFKHPAGYYGCKGASIIYETLLDMYTRPSFLFRSTQGEVFRDEILQPSYERKEEKKRVDNLYKYFNSGIITAEIGQRLITHDLKEKQKLLPKSQRKTFVELGLMAYDIQLYGNEYGDTVTRSIPLPEEFQYIDDPLDDGAHSDDE
ncbi:hypothetical protein BJV82DRAFT_641671 [Fennellomyces sp. T-0311]|nr:hypothetical protein BJV82DRAFT_641671 [Fennellomyces sp. T-0311]